MTGVGIGLLDLYASDDVFIGSPLDEVAGRLRAQHCRVEQYRSVLSTDGGGDLEQWHERIRAFVARGRFDIVVVARAWDPRSVQAIRAALHPGARLVRLASGTRSPIDEHFDYVVGVEGIEALIRGEEPADGGKWRPTSPGEIRLRAQQRRMDTGPEAVAVEGRPTISGPVSGCPFLLDARKNEHFARLDMDPGSIQTRGCTFCLDNVGSYAVVSGQEVVETWLSRLRAVRAARPDATEVLLVDERPHPYLPALFRCIADEPALWGLELLIKSRVDWLLEFADSALSEAIVEARKSSSVLHIYLVGFESFDQFHLDLFNKGCTVDDNVRAIETLRRLKRSFPDAFEFEKFRAHGIVVFTPWTTPEHVIDNARIMQEVRFDELRDDAVHTRLRLYSRVPLHALAEAEGLLVPQFEESRGDRAAEQGYDASVPWRFKDARTEAVFRIASCRPARSHLSSDARLLEAAARFVQRWPGLQDVPDLAVLPFMQAARALLPRNRGECPAALYACDYELELVALGKRRGCLKENISVGSVRDLVRAYQAMGFEAAEVSTYALERGADHHSKGADYAIVAIARDKADLDALLDAQRRHRHGEGRDIEAARYMGQLMGYPDCCIEAFLAQDVRGDNLANERLPFRRGWDRRLAPELNRLGVARVVAHHVCSPDCDSSVLIAQLVIGLARSASAAAAEWLEDRLSRPVLMLDFQRVLELEGAWEGDMFRVTSVFVPVDDRHLGFETQGITGLEVEEEAVRIHLKNGRSRTVAAHAPLLVVPGEALAPSAVKAVGGPWRPRERPPRRTVSGPLPPLPGVIRPGVRIQSYRIARIQADEHAHQVTLAAADHRFLLDIRPFEAAPDEGVECGPWTVTVSDIDSLPLAARRAVGVFLHALHAASAERRPGAAPARPADQIKRT